MYAKEFPQFLITGRCIFGKSWKFNHRIANQNQVEFIKDKLEQFVSDPLVITGEKNINTAQYINAILQGG